MHHHIKVIGILLIAFTTSFSGNPDKIDFSSTQEKSSVNGITEYPQILGPIRIIHKTKCFFVYFNQIGSDIDYKSNPLHPNAQLRHSGHDMYITYVANKGYQISVDADHKKVIAPELASIRKQGKLLIQNNEHSDHQYWRVEKRAGQYIFQNRRSQYFIGAIRGKMAQVDMRNAFMLEVIQLPEEPINVVIEEEEEEVIYSKEVKIGEEVIKNGRIVWVDGMGGGIVVSNPITHSRDSGGTYTEDFTLDEALKIINNGGTGIGTVRCPSSAEFEIMRPGMQEVYPNSQARFWLRGSSNDYGRVGNMSGNEATTILYGQSGLSNGSQAMKLKVVKIVIFENIDDLQESGIGF